MTMDNRIEVVIGGLTIRIPRSELIFRTTRSGGPGGQNVNKVETRIQLEFDIAHSQCLSDEQRQLLLDRLGTRLNSAGILRIVAQESRSQWSNRERAVKKLVDLLRTALRLRKKRVPTKRSPGSAEKRLLAKKKRGETKRLRGRPGE